MGNSASSGGGGGNPLGGILAIAGIVVGVLILTGVFGTVSGIGGTILTILGVGLLIAGVVVVGFVAVAIIAAILASKPDKNQESKMATKTLINKKRQQLNKLKSKAALLKDSEYSEEMNQSIAELEAEIAELESRRNDALAKMTAAEAVKLSTDDTDDQALEKLEEQAQYEKDYADAMKQLSR